jgi:hypothetical protein
MKRTPLPLFEGFIETPFEQRFQELLRQAWRSRRWHVIVAEPGSGKTMGIRDLSAQASREAGMMGGRRYPVLAVTAPKNDAKEAALGNFLLTALGLGARGHWSERKYLLFELLLQYGVECLVIDDAHDLSMPHLIFLRIADRSAPINLSPLCSGVVPGGSGAGSNDASQRCIRSTRNDVAAISAQARSCPTLLSDCQSYGGGSASYSAGSGTDLSSLFSRTGSVSVDREHLHLAHSPPPRSTKKWACAHGPPDEAGHNGTGVVVGGSRERCQSQTSRSCCRTTHPSARRDLHC